MIRLTTTKLELNCMVMNNNQLLALKEALFAGRFNYMNNSSILYFPGVSVELRSRCFLLTVSVRRCLAHWMTRSHSELRPMVILIFMCGNFYVEFSRNQPRGDGVSGDWYWRCSQALMRAATVVSKAPSLSLLYSPTTAVRIRIHLPSHCT